MAAATDTRSFRSSSFTAATLVRSYFTSPSMPDCVANWPPAGHTSSSILGSCSDFKCVDRLYFGLKGSGSPLDQIFWLFAAPGRQETHEASIL